MKTPKRIQYALWVLAWSLSQSLVLPTSAPAHAADVKLAATVRQRVHPVLIRNPHSAILHVILDVENEPVDVTSFAFRLAGCDDVADLTSVAMFYTGDDDEFATDAPFGKPQAATEELIIQGKRALEPGRHVFWLAGNVADDADLSHQIDAECTSVATSAGAVTPIDETPAVRKRIGIALRRHMDQGVHTYRIPALATTNDGTLLCVYDMRRRKSRDLQEDIDIGLSRSTDGGRTWAPSQVIMDMGTYGGLPQEQNGCSDPGIVVDRETGASFCAAVWMWGKPGKHQWRDDGSEPGFEIGKSAQFLMVRSSDDGLTWSEPKNMTRTLKREAWVLLAPAPQQGITLADGTVVLPSQGRDEQGRPFSCLLYSKNHGDTWTVSEPTDVGNDECQAVELSDGSVLLNCRSRAPVKHRSVYVTDDLGATWQEHSTHRGTLIEPNCNGSLCRIDAVVDGKQQPILLFANPATQDGRHHHTLRVSFDEGRTWPEDHWLLLDEGLGRGYPSISPIDDEHVGIVYEGSQADVVFQRIAIADLLGR